MWKLRVLIAAATVASFALVPLRAAAVTFTMPVEGTAWIGMNSGGAWMAVQPTSGGACQWVFLSDGYTHGLYTDTIIQGTSGSDNIQVILDSPQSNACGSWTPLEYNGHVMDIYGGDGWDVIFAGIGGFDANYVFGQGGGDIMDIDQWGGYGSGGTGPDQIFGVDQSVDRLLGGDGNDSLCEYSGSVVQEMAGGAGTDRRCGSAVTVTSVENSNGCTFCGNP